MQVDSNTDDCLYWKKYLRLLRWICSVTSQTAWTLSKNTYFETGNHSGVQNRSTILYHSVVQWCKPVTTKNLIS